MAGHGEPRQSPALRPGEQTAATVRAVEMLRTGEVVALPTETVYGLAADALRPEAVAKIFGAKERPRFDPLIVHVPDHSWFQRIARVSAEEKEIVSELIEAFWPGPFTVVLPKTDVVPDIVTAGLETVAVRISADPVFQEIITAFGRPLAAPSANRFGRISPTTAQHVLGELGTRIPLIVDGGPTPHGLESTVVTMAEGKLQILRPGPITAEQLQRFAPVEVVGRQEIVTAPGQLPSHYAPHTSVKVTDDAGKVLPDEKQRVGLLAWNPVHDGHRFATIRQLSERQDLREAAVNLFRYLRELDEANLDLIVVEFVPEHGLGVAINDRLRRASARM